MKVHKAPFKNGKQGYYARVGDFFGTLSNTPQEAIQSLDAQLEAFHPLNQTYIRCQDGTVLHIFQVPSNGWTINVVGPESGVGKSFGAQVETLGAAKLKAQQWADENAGGLL